MATSPIQSHPKTPISKLQRRIVVGYRPNQGNSDTPALKLSGQWLKEIGFDTGTGVSVRISEGCIVLIADNQEMQTLREQLCRTRRAVEEVRDIV